MAAASAAALQGVCVKSSTASLRGGKVRGGGLEGQAAHALNARGREAGEKAHAGVADATAVGQIQDAQREL